jgi:hypothetical protein
MLNANIYQSPATTRRYPYAASAPLTHRAGLPAEERSKIDQLLAAALLDGGVAERLLYGPDDALLAAYRFAEETRHWLCSLQATSLEDLAQQITALW